MFIDRSVEGRSCCCWIVGGTRIFFNVPSVALGGTELALNLAAEEVDVSETTQNSH